MLFASPRKKALKILKNQSVDPKDRHGIELKPLLDRFRKKTPAGKKVFNPNHLGLDLINDTPTDTERVELDQRYQECTCHFDADFYLVLTYTPVYLTPLKPVGICLAGFNLERRKRLCIVQIQGLRCDNFNEFLYKQGEFLEFLEILHSIRWEKLLVAALEQWAKKMGFKKIGIQKAKHNDYFNHDNLNTPKNWRLKMHYDVTAQRMGYKATKRSKYFFKNL